MKSCKNRPGFTLVEMLIVVAIVAILAAIAIGIAAHVDNQAKQRLMKDTFAILNAALGQFRDYGYAYDRSCDFNDLDFPADCNGFILLGLRDTLADGLGLNTSDISILGIGRDGTAYDSVDEDPNSAGCEVMCFFLNRIAECRQSLNRIDGSLLTSQATAGGIKIDKVIKIYNKREPLLRVIDPWGQTLRYDYYDELQPDYEDIQQTKRNFPLVTSAGPDGIFNTNDDMTNR